MSHSLAEKVILDKDSELMIHGETNVNRFTCHYTSLGEKDTLEFILDEEKTNAKFINSELRLYIDEFDCGSKLINKDFRDLLKEEEYPYIVIDFMHVEFDPDYRSPDPHDIGYFDVAIQVAGTFKDEKVHFERVSDNNKELFIGETELDIREFGLSAPDKFMGLIKVKEEIRIELKFYMLAL